MRTAHPLAHAYGRSSARAELDLGLLDGMLQHVPQMDLSFDGDCAQPDGLDLPVVVINLPHRIDRWEALARRMSAVGLTKLIKAPAVEGARLTNRQIAELLGSPVDRIDEAPRSHLTLTRPAIGCFLSHLAIWRWMLGMNLPRVLVLEDDAAPAAHYSAAHLRSVVDSLSKEAGLVFLGRIIMGGLADKPEGTGVARIYYFNGTFAYLITPVACRSLLGHLLPLRSHIDHQISSVLIERRHVFQAYDTEPHFFEPDWSLRSDCYVPLADDVAADRELGRIIDASRRTLLEEGRPLLPTS
jgi:glycosyl transferase, family 25